MPTTKKISIIGLGTWQFGSREWGYGAAYHDVEAANIVRRALELGVTLFDTAELYAFGRSERILGRALTASPEAAAGAVVATKLFPLLPVAPVVEQRAVASADRLGVQTIDLYQVHGPNPLVGDGTTMRGMATLRRIGLVDDVGVSKYSLRRWRDAEQALGRPVLSNQVEYSLIHRAPESDLLAYAAEARRLVIAYSPLAQGLLSGRYDVTNRPVRDFRATNPLFLAENLARAAPLLDVVREVAAAHGATCAQVALAWVVRHPNVVAIPGASSVAQVEENAAAADIDLTDDEVSALSAASEAFIPLAGRAAWAALAGERLGDRRVPFSGSGSAASRTHKIARFAPDLMGPPDAATPSSRRLRLNDPESAASGDAATPSSRRLRLNDPESAASGDAATPSSRRLWPFSRRGCGRAG